jgi:hypothetical protein
VCIKQILLHAVSIKEIRLKVFTISKDHQYTITLKLWELTPISLQNTVPTLSLHGRSFEVEKLRSICAEFRVKNYQQSDLLTLHGKVYSRSFSMMWSLSFQNKKKRSLLKGSLRRDFQLLFFSQIRNKE